MEADAGLNIGPGNGCVCVRDEYLDLGLDLLASASVCTTMVISQFYHRLAVLQNATGSSVLPVPIFSSDHRVESDVWMLVYHYIPSRAMADLVPTVVRNTTEYVAAYSPERTAREFIFYPYASSIHTSQYAFPRAYLYHNL